tara:strand:+ start:357 stop:1643 length:1287 start_codon:yes stop_codon:yes gene_type:complete
MAEENYNDIKLIDHLKSLFPICRSITGNGTRKTLKYFEKFHKDYRRLKFKTGLKVLDWEIPKEWNIKNGYFENIETGEKFAEFKKNNLHIVNYSEPVNSVIDYEQLIKRIHTIKEKPDWIPYITSYYKKYWGFCIKHTDKEKLKTGKYRVYIDSSLKDGELELSHAILKGKSKKEILFSSYICHPSMANNELSGPVVLNALLDYVKKRYPKRRYSYRFILQPETIGSIAYISKYKHQLRKNVLFGFNLSCVGDNRSYSYVNTPHKNTIADQALNASLLNLSNVNAYSFLDRGSDERQYCSPGLKLPVCTFSRSKFGKYPEYHTSADNLDLVSEEGLKGSFEILKNIIDACEIGLYPKVKTICEPQLGKRGLYPNISETQKKRPSEIRMNFIAYCDGVNNIFEICKLIECDLKTVLKEYKLLKENNLII